MNRSRSVGRTLKSIERWCRVIERVYMVGLLCVMVALVSFQIVARFVFAFGFPWSEETARLLLVIFIYLGIGPLTRTRHWVRVDVLPRFFPQRQRVFGAIAASVGVMFSVLIMAMGFRLAAYYYSIGMATPASGVPLWVPISAIGVGGLWAIPAFVAQVVEEWSLRRQE